MLHLSPCACMWRKLCIITFCEHAQGYNKQMTLYLHLLSKIFDTLLSCIEDKSSLTPIKGIENTQFLPGDVYCLSWKPDEIDISNIGIKW